MFKNVSKLQEIKGSSCLGVMECDALCMMCVCSFCGSFCSVAQCAYVWHWWVWFRFLDWFLIEAHVPFLMSVWQLSLSAVGVLLGFSFFRVEGLELGLVTCVLSSY